MKPFVIEIYWPDLKPALVGELVARTVRVTGGNDASVTLIGCEIAPRDETCYLRVAADDGSAVGALIERLGLEGARVVELVEVRAPQRSIDDASRSPQ